MANNVAKMPEIQTRLPMTQGALARGITPAQWRVLVETTFPSAKTPEAIEMAFDYCAARGLDVFKKPVHIVPMWSSEKKGYIETVWPGINEIQITAARTEKWAGMDSPKWGPLITETFEGTKSEWVNGRKSQINVSVKVTYPEWCEVPVYRLVGGQPRAFCEPVFWVEAYSRAGGKDSDLPTDMWIKRPRGQLHKTAKAASLRAAFPEEGELTAEEMEGKEIDVGGATGSATVVNHRPATPSLPPPTAPVEEESDGLTDEQIALIAKFEADLKEKLDAVASTEDLDDLWRSGVNTRIREIRALDEDAGNRMVSAFSQRKNELTKRAEEVRAAETVEAGEVETSSPTADPATQEVQPAAELSAHLIINPKGAEFQVEGTPGVTDWPKWGRACIEAVKSISDADLLDKWVARHEKTIGHIAKLTVIGKLANGDDLTGPQLSDMIKLWVRRQRSRVAGTNMQMRHATGDAPGSVTDFHADPDDWADGLMSMAKSPATYGNVAYNIEQAKALIEKEPGSEVATKIHTALDLVADHEAKRKAAQEAA